MEEVRDTIEAIASHLCFLLYSLRIVQNMGETSNTDSKRARELEQMLINARGMRVCFAYGTVHFPHLTGSANRHCA